MTTRSPVIGFERLLTALGQDLIDAADEEMLAVVHELGLRPEMQGSVALYGVTFAVRKKRRESAIRVRQSSTTSAVRGRRRPKGDAPS